MPIYYEDQTNWDETKFYTLWRYLNRFFLRHKKNMEEIKAIDLSLCSTETKTLMACFLQHQELEDVLALPNMAELKNIAPLEKRLIIIDPPTNGFEIFEKYNIQV